jgi:hypothetical protein
LSTEQVPLRHRRRGAPAVAALREPCGRDEMAVDGVDTRAALALLDRLLGGAAAPQACQLCAADRDALLAALHRECWGDQIVSTLTCVACGKRFDLSFELSAVQCQLAAAKDGSWRASGDGRVLGPDASFGVPSGEEELEAAGRGAREGAAWLAAGCGATAGAIDVASAALESAAPIIDLELLARCADCGHEQAAHFDLQSFVMQRLFGERETLLSEIHLLAAGYGWSLREILSLSRSTRRSLTARVLEARSRAAGPRPRAAR